MVGFGGEKEIEERVLTGVEWFVGGLLARETQMVAQIHWVEGEGNVKK